MSDFQYIQSILDELMIQEFAIHDGHNLGPAEIHEYLSQVMYARRSKMNPLWNSLIVGGYQNGKRCEPTAWSFLYVLSECGSGSFLAYVDLLGTTYSASTLATGYGSYLAQPLLRKAVEGREHLLTEDEACRILEESMRVLYYRDARSINKVSIFFPAL
jgi:20S proteasome subunit beta 7